MRFTTVSDGIRKIGDLIEKSDDSGFNIGKIVSDPIIMSAIAAGIVLLVVIFAVVISKSFAFLALRHSPEPSGRRHETESRLSLSAAVRLRPGLKAIR